MKPLYEFEATFLDENCVPRKCWVVGTSMAEAELFCITLTPKRWKYERIIKVKVQHNKKERERYYSRLREVLIQKEENEPR